MLGFGSTGSSDVQTIEAQRQSQFMKMNIHPLLPSEWEIFRYLRLLALKSAPGMFESTYAQAATRSEADCRALLSGEQQQIFGMFDSDKLVGARSVRGTEPPAFGRAGLLNKAVRRDCSRCDSTSFAKNESGAHKSPRGMS
jgi:hypothetical protein